MSTFIAGVHSINLNAQCAEGGVVVGEEGGGGG